MADCPYRNSSITFTSSLNERFGTPDNPPKCTWTKDADPATSPHSQADWKTQRKIYPDVLKAVGHTPLVKLNSLPKVFGLNCEVYAKCEFFNPGGSVKDRIGFRMIEEAEKQGLLKPGSTIIEPTSGNTGIGLALGAAVKGYRCIIVISEKMSNEKIDVLKALGAEVVRTPISADSHALEGLFGVSNRLKNEIPNSIILDQYSNPGNPLAHYDCTAEEILDQCDGKVDMIVVGAGTGGTITGIGKKIKEKSPNTIIVGVDPFGSILALPDYINRTNVDFYEVEGLGYDFVPTGLDRSVVDRWIKVGDKESLIMSRRLIKEEGLLCGGSSGANVFGAMQAAGILRKGQKCVVILPDSIRNYITKFVSDHWMESKRFLKPKNVNQHWWWEETVENFKLEPLIAGTVNMTSERVLHMMRKQGIDQMPIVDKNGSVVSMVTMQNILNTLISGNSQSNESIEKACINIFPKVFLEDNLGLVSRILEREHYALVVEKKPHESGVIEKPLGIITAVDLLHFITNGKDKK